MSKEIDWVGQQALNILTKNHGESYAQSKAGWFEGRNRFECILALNNFDPNNLADLAALLKIPLDDLKITIRTLRHF